jgi:hypothetical protein
VLEGARGDGGHPGRVVRPLAEWSAVAAAATGMAFLPLILGGVFGDFLRGLAVARYGGDYNRTTWSTFAEGVGLQFQAIDVTLLFAAVALLSVLGPAALKGTSRTWALALTGALFYKPMSPVPHSYLDLPLVLLRAINLAPLTAWVLATPRLTDPLRLATVAVVLHWLVPGAPANCSMSRSLQAVGSLVLGVDPAATPIGCVRGTPGQFHMVRHYQWVDYCRLLNYLRTSVPQTTRVASVLRALPFPTVNGPSGRLSVFPAAGGLIHLRRVDPDLEDRFVEALDTTADSVAVWVPAERDIEPGFRFPRLEEAIRRNYRPASRFGIFQVWTNRRPAPTIQTDR